MVKWWRQDHALYKPDSPDLTGDPAALRVYRMERDWVGWHKNTTVDESYLNEMALDACKTFRVKVMPEIYVVNKRTVDIGWCTAEGIFLNRYKDGANYAILIHEVAHWIADDLYGADEIEGHGPEWAFVYIELLDRYKFLPRWLSTQMFDKYGIEY